MQKLRIRFSRGAALKYISHLDIIRLWHRAFRRAGLDVAYSEGFNPHPRIHIAAPLPLGVTAGSELMDVVFAREYLPHSVLHAVNPQLPAGMAIEQAMAVPLNAPSLQGQMSRALYRVEVPVAAGRQEAEAAVSHLLGLKTLPWEHQRQDKTRSYDLRAQIKSITIKQVAPASLTLSMDLQCDSSGSGKPEQVTRALGFPPPSHVHRTRLILETS
jgi:radical SAM-linked protein